MRNNKISLQGLAHIGEFIGGIAIIISLVYLAMQVSDSNRLLRSQAHYNALTLAQGPGAMMIQNPELSTLIVRCQAGDDDLSPAVLARCNHYALMEINGWEYLYYQHLDNSIPLNYGWVQMPTTEMKFNLKLDMQNFGRTTT